jgi:hypothetical protein
VTTTESVGAVLTSAAEDLAVIERASTATSCRLLDEIEGLRRALETRSLIGQAIGIVMSRETLTADAAFAQLVDRSSRANTKLRDIAAAIVEETERRVDVVATSRLGGSGVPPTHDPRSREHDQGKC